MVAKTCTPADKLIRKIISNNLHILLRQNNKKQIDITKVTKIPKSTINGYVNGTSLPTPNNIQKLATFFNVTKAEIDPRFKDSISNDIYVEAKDNPFLTWEGQPLSKDELDYMTEQLRMYRSYKKNKRQNER
ncbi:hypothetical protein A3P64_09235 [Lactobacillus johnsonii]|uniref:HTH cro/C1-type domain-containing protein n=1 Tax=Lactobacillus johnsonii TaxID=33959 RepID=A0AAX0PTQ9_LACJH|nr:helix-turn-helix transcriptional regulator [Lactobacillus johnsonii]PAB40659.1 hypothetical protein A3P60_09370 [Lactobacillus johnsonii]PAB51963.1 hypothetical protein A3P64_09235 [Lactobacillus johnsonii]